MNKFVGTLFGISVLLLNTILIVSSHSFAALYYIFWVGGVGVFLWKKKASIEEKLKTWVLPSFPKFVLLGIGMILFEEMLASFSVNVSPALTVSSYTHFVLQYWATNLLTLAGFVIGWYLLLSRFQYTKKETLFFAGIFGLFAEKVIYWIFAMPLMGILLIIPTMFTYAIIITPSVLSIDMRIKRPLSAPIRYFLALLIPFLVSVPFIGILLYLMTVYPQVFYIPNNSL